ncbi:SPASM domain-containing protein [Cyanobium gracile UHCC 0139]|uniref:SPASM domain-containing protein n=1 Tax=Cyanobium gracile UHCC 0139 TaxID=3110308 RepID=A0ABU5RWD4_9CYAN|nr:SPASM domain-containing protein [Cyanobium gracile]MEA5392101.1 SPASM domain-containing protein [Cyanobium gracile UHCC 0139]
MLQRSQFNYFVKREDGILGYNARTGIFALLSDHIAGTLQSSDPIKSVKSEKELTNMGFLHNGDEIDQIISIFEDERHQASRVSLTILPTLACNFSCDYCFQGDHSHGQFMSPNTQEASLRYVRSLLEEEGRSTFDCTWFGGEPLLAKETVINMSRQLNALAENLGLPCPDMKIITNGTLLTPSTSKDLSEVGVSFAQISFDSLVFKGKHKRGVMDVNGDPSIILKNIIDANKYLTIRVRINVSTENLSEVPEIISYLGKYGIENIYAERVFAHENEFASNDDSGCTVGSCGDCRSEDVSRIKESSSLSRADYASFEKEHFLENISDNPVKFKDLVKKLVPKKHFCGATLGNMHVIDPAGFISRCWHSAGSPAEAMANVHKLHLSDNASDIARRWREFTPFAYPACHDCKVLPLCMGGCSHPRVFMNAAEPPCDSIKHHIQFCVDQVGSAIDLRLQNSANTSEKATGAK